MRSWIKPKLAQRWNEDDCRETLWWKQGCRKKKKQVVTRKCLVSLSSCCIGVILNQMENDWSHHNCKSAIYWVMTYLAREESQMKGLSCRRVGLSSSVLISLTWRWSRGESVEMITISIGATRSLSIYTVNLIFHSADELKGGHSPCIVWVVGWCFGKRKSRGKTTFTSLVKVDWREKHWHHVNNWELLSRWDSLKIQKMETAMVKKKKKRSK